MSVGELTFIGFCSLAAINALFFAGYLWFRRETNLRAASLLSLLLVITAYRIVKLLLHDLQDDFNIGLNPRSVLFFIPTFPLLGPLLFLYIKSLSLKTFTFSAKQLLHLLPFFLILVLDIINRDKYLQSSSDRSYYTFYCIEISFILTHFLIYIGLSWKYLRKVTRATTEETYINNERISFHIKNIILAISIIWVLYLVYCIQIFIRTYLPTQVYEALYYSVLSYLILYIELRTKKISSVNLSTARYKDSQLTSEDAARYKTLILECMSKEKLHQDHNITLVKFSRALSLKPHIVSQVINEQLSCNFNDFINSYRIEDAKKMLLDTSLKNYTVASIAYDCGFNTLSAFNTSFKKFTGITPSQFRNRN